jgi:hypothetical protein
MARNARTGSGDDEILADAGASTDQHVTGGPETGTFITDQEPTADTPADGSTNAGINATKANRPDFDADAQP